MEEKILQHDKLPITLEEQEQAWKIYLVILEALIKLDLLKKNL
jgi:hypothetical protein